MPFPDGKPQMEDRPSSTRLFLRPSSALPPGSMTSSTTESTLWTSQGSLNDDSFTTSFGLCTDPKETSDLAPAPTHKYQKCREETKRPNLDSYSHHAIVHVKSSQNDSRHTECMRNNQENEIGSPRSFGATAVSPCAPNHLESPIRTERPTLKGHGFLAADFFPQCLLSKDPVHKFDSLHTFTKLLQPP